MSNVRSITDRSTRKPSGKPPWPILLVAGAEKAGKTYAAAAASASDLIGRTFWVGIGEDDPDEYGAIPGARFEIVEHDGTYRDILAALTWAGQQPVKGKPNLIVVDSATRLWDLLCDEAQVAANRRAAEKAKKYNRPVGDEDAQITMDLWNAAKQRWSHCIDTLREHQGPSIVTARLEQTTVMNDKGEPTKDKVWKVKAEKSLPFDVGATVELPSRGQAYLTGVRSLRFKPAEADRTEYPGFTVDKLWRDLGLADGTGARSHAAIDPEDKPAAEADAARAALRATCTENGWEPRAVAAAFADRNGGLPLTEATAAEVEAHAAWCVEHFKEIQAS